MAYPINRVSVSCPNCQHPATLTLQQVIDIAEDPALRDRLLRGRLNVLVCSNCGTRAAMAVPLVYHDPDKPLFLAYLPNELQMTMAQEEQEIGRLSNLVLNNTPPEKRKGYLLTPTRVMSMDALVEKIMVAEGVDVEELRAQQKAIRLIGQMADMGDNPQKFAAFVEENREAVDRKFMTLLAALIAQAEQGEEAEMASTFRGVRDKIIEQLDLGKDDLPDLSPAAIYNSLIDTLQETDDDDRFQIIVAANRGHLDYSFFMHLTQRADAAPSEEKQKLLALRNRVLDVTDALDREAKRSIQRAADQLGQLLQAADPAATLQQLAPELDESFLMVLAANIDQAQKEGQEEVVEVLTRLQAQVDKALESQMEPELRAVNELLRQESPQAQQRYLEETIEELGAPALIRAIEQLATEMERLREVPPEMIDDLYSLADHVREMAAGKEQAPASPTHQSEIFTPGQTSPSNEDTPRIILPK